jgi:hypothetical protein
MVKHTWLKFWLNLKFKHIVKLIRHCEATFVPLLPVLQGDYAWKHEHYRWRTNVNVFLDVRLRS